MTKLDYISLGRECSNREEWLLKTSSLRVNEEDAIMWARFYTDMRKGKEKSIWDWLNGDEVKKQVEVPTANTILDTANKSTSLASLGRKLYLSQNKLRNLCESLGIWEKVKYTVEMKRHTGYNFGRRKK